MPDRHRGGMIGNGLQLASFIGFTAGVGLLMIVAGTEKRMLVWKFGRRCGSCGETLRHCHCPHRREF
ncbi:MAG: hypothetical protein WCH31_01285 [Actinomycetes bacterium]